MLWHHQQVTTPLRQLGHGTGAIAAIGVVALGAASCGTSAPMPSSEDLASDTPRWHESGGYDVPERGRIPADVRSAYDAAN